MAGERQLPGIGLTGFWNLGSAYKAEMDANLRTLSAVVGASVKSATTELPVSPAAGDIYIVPSGSGANPNQIAIWDGEVGSESWVYIVPKVGLQFTLEDTGARTVWDGSNWRAVLVGSEIKSLYEAEADTNAFTDAEKSKLAGLDGSLFLGTFVNITALATAHPAPAVGSYAHVDAGVGADIDLYIWDDTDGEYVALAGGSGSETASSIKTKYESNPDTNAFTDAEKTKLNGVEEGATAGGSATMTQTELTGTTHTVNNTDLAGNVVRKLNNAAAITVTVAPSLTGTEPSTWIQTGVGQVTFAAGSGVTIYSADGNLSIATRYGSASLIPDAALTDTFYLVGHLTT